MSIFSSLSKAVKGVNRFILKGVDKFHSAVGGAATVNAYNAYYRPTKKEPVVDYGNTEISSSGAFIGPRYSTPDPSSGAFRGQRYSTPNPSSGAFIGPRYSTPDPSSFKSGTKSIQVGGKISPESNYSSGSYSPSGGSGFFVPTETIKNTVSAGSIGSGTPKTISPSSPGTSNMQGVVNGLNAASGIDVNSGVNPVTGEVTQKEGDTKTATDIYQEEMAKLQDKVKSPDMVSAYNKAQAESGKMQAQQKMNNTQSQITGVTAKMNTDLLNYRSAIAREGGTMGGFGGVEAEVTREATIKLLPLQAQLATDQGNYQLATEHMDTLFNIYFKEAQNSADLWNRNVESHQALLTNKEKQRVADISSQKQYAVDTLKTMGTDQKNYVNEFLKNGNRVAAAAMSAIRPPNNINSRTLEMDTANYRRDVSSVLDKYGASIGALDRQEQQGRINRANAEKEERIGQYSPKQLTAITKLNQDVSKNSTYSKTTSMRGFGDNVIASLSLTSGVGDISAINQFQKVIDEGAVTREQDVKLIQASQSLVNTLKTKIKKLEKGEQLSPQLRYEMRQSVELMYEKQVEALLKDPFISAKKKEAELNGFDMQDTILGELNTFSNQASAPTSNEGSTKEYKGVTYKVIKGVWIPQ